MIDAAKENITSIGKSKNYFKDQVFTANFIKRVNNLLCKNVFFDSLCQ